MTGRKIFEKYNFLIQSLTCIYRIFPFSFRLWLFHHTNVLPGNLGYLQRYLLAKTLMKSCGKNVRIEPHVIIKDIRELSIGDNVSINSFTYIIASGGITIGNNVSIAHSSSIISESHTWADKDIPIVYNKIIPTPVQINSDVWIACGVRIIGPCNINSRVIIAAGAVVKGNIEGGNIYGGVPAKPIRNI